MATIGDLKFKVLPDPFFTDPRMRVCLNGSCKHNLMHIGTKEAGHTCHLRLIEIGKDGQCLQFEKKVE